MKSEEYIYNNMDETLENMQEAEAEISLRREFPGYRQTKKQRIRTQLRRKHVFLKVFLVLFLILCAFLTPIFNVSNIVVVGNSFLSEEKIIDASGISMKKNIFTFQCSKVKDEVEKLSFIDIANVKKEFPSEIIITVTECIPVAQIKCGQSLYLVVDKSGKVLDTADNTEKYGVTVVDGLSIMEFEVGENLKPEDTSVLNLLFMLADQIKQNGAEDITEKIYHDGKDLILCLKGNKRCNIGTGESLSYRVKFVKEVYKSIPEEKTGKLEFVEEYKAVFTEDENGN